ncbi:MAG: hypothetical protein WBG85_03725 [Rhodanobacter sp.]
MKCLHAAFGILLLTGSSVAMAASPPQVFASVSFTEPSGNAVGQGIVVTDAPGFLDIGHQNGYPAILCTASSRSLKAVTLFSGYVIDYALDGKDVVLTVKKYAVHVPPEAAYNVTKTCTSATPQQQTLVNKTYRLPVGTSNQSVKLPDGSVMKYSVSGLAS